MNTRLSLQELDRAEDRIRAELRRVGMKWTKERSAALRAFLQSTGPLTVDELHRLVKKEMITASYSSVYRTLKTIAACGLAQEGVAEDRKTTTYLNRYSSQCTHKHLVCKDCGAVVEMEKPGVSHEPSASRVGEY